MGQLASPTRGTLDAFDKIFDTNVHGLIRITQLCVPYLKETKGSIVMVSSIGSQMIVSFEYSTVPYRTILRHSTVQCIV